MVLRKRLLYPKDFLTGSFEIFALKAHHKRLTLRFAIPGGLPRMFVDPILLAQVFYCLVDRAIAVTPTGGVTIRAGMTLGRLVIAVEDEGPWVAPMEVAKLFGEASPDEDLCLAARLARALGGELTATGEGRRHGLCVTLTVPAKTLRSPML
jgi:signal transduction histidine kinase